MKPPANQIPLPSLLVRLLAEGRWQQPPDAFLSTLVPSVGHLLNFLPTEEAMRRESGCSFLDNPQWAEMFRLYRGGSGKVRPLPWLDADLLLFVAVNRYGGDDVAIALDYRTSLDDPRVVASEWAADNTGNYWREVFPTLSAFVAALYPTA